MVGVLVYIKTNPSPEQIEREITNEKRWCNEEVLRLTYFQEPDTKLCFIRKGESSIIRDLSWVPCTDEVLNVIKNGRPNDR